MFHIKLPFLLTIIHHYYLFLWYIYYFSLLLFILLSSIIFSLPIILLLLLLLLLYYHSSNNTFSRCSAWPQQASSTTREKNGGKNGMGLNVGFAGGAHWERVMSSSVLRRTYSVFFQAIGEGWQGSAARSSLSPCGRKRGAQSKKDAGGRETTFDIEVHRDGHDGMKSRRLGGRLRSTVHADRWWLLNEAELVGGQKAQDAGYIGPSSRSSSKKKRPDPRNDGTDEDVDVIDRTH